MGTNVLEVHPAGEAQGVELPGMPDWVTSASVTDPDLTASTREEIRRRTRTPDSEFIDEDDVDWGEVFR